MFLVFSYRNYYPEGGPRDLNGKISSLKGSITYVQELSKKHPDKQHFQIFDLNEMKIIKWYYRNNNTGELDDKTEQFKREGLY
jgi:hypothetical protein